MSGLTRSTRPGASCEFQESPPSGLTHTVPGRSHVPESATQTTSPSAAPATTVSGVAASVFGLDEEDGVEEGEVLRDADAAVGDAVGPAVETVSATSAGSGRTAHAMRAPSTRRSATSPTTGATLRSSIGTDCQTPPPIPTPRPGRLPAPPSGAPSNFPDRSPLR